MSKTALKFKKCLVEYQKQTYIKEVDDCNDEVLIDCALGINPFGYSKAVEAFAKSFPFNPTAYPSYPYVEARAAISAFWAEVVPLRIDNFRLYGGSVAVLEAVCRAFTDNGTKVLGYAPQFAEFAFCVSILGGVYETVALDPKENYRFNAERFCAAMTDEYALAYLDNPNNPTGQVIPLRDIERIVKHARTRGIAVLVDEAYGDFITKNESAIALLGQYDNLMVARSFSKGYGLAGLRVGYLACGGEIMRYCDKVSVPFSVTPVAAAAAVEATKDEAFIVECRAKVAEKKQYLLEALRHFDCLETDMRVPIMTLVDRKGRNLYQLLRKQGVLTESGDDIDMGRSAVRLRISSDAERLVRILNDPSLA